MQGEFKSIGIISFSVLLISSLFVIVNNSTLAAEPADPNAGTTNSSDQVAVASGSNRFVVWYDGTPGNFDIFLRRSTDSGATWQPAVNLSTNPGPSILPQIAVSGPNVYVVWTQLNSDSTLGDIFIRKSTDNGVTWGSKVKLSVSPYVGTNLEASSRIAVSGANVHVVWTNDALQILERRSTDSGATWKSIDNLSTTGLAHEPSVAVFGSNVYVAWMEEGHDNSDVFVRRSTDNGATWKSKVNLSNSCSGCLADMPQVAVSGSNVYVAWSGAGKGPGLSLRSSTDNGATWKSIVNINGSEESTELTKLIALGSKVYVVWSEHKFENQSNDTFFRRSTDSGATWKPVRNLSNDLNTSHAPQMGAAGSNVYVVWAKGINGTQADIVLRRSTDNGATWKSIVNMSNNAGISFDPQVAASGSNVYIVWNDQTPGNYDILLKRSTDNGATWKSIKNLSNNTGNSNLPQIGV
jgi:hypothetical protein